MSASLGPKISFSVNRFKKLDSSVDYEKLRKSLSSFQIEKLTFFFRAFYDVNQDGIINAEDFLELNKRLRKHAGWDENSEEFKAVVDHNNVFLECLLDQVKVELEQNQEGLEDRTWEEALRPQKLVVSSVSLNQWLNMWAYLCSSASGMSGFPIWVQLIPQIMFAVQVGQDKGNQITKQHLRNFYKVFSGKEGPDLDALAENGYNTMTANGDYILDLSNYELLFSNFLLGKTIYGPGKYIFGCFDNSDLQRKYEIIHEVE